MEAYKPEIMAWLEYMPTQVVNEVALTQGWSLQEIPFELRRQVKQEARAVILSALRDSVHRSVALNVFSVRRPYLYPAIPFHFMQRSFLQDKWFSLKTCGSWRLAFLLARLQRDIWLSGVHIESALGTS